MKLCSLCRWLGSLLSVALFVSCSGDTGGSSRSAQFSSKEETLVANLVEQHPGLVVRPVESSPSQQPSRSAAPPSSPELPAEQQQEVGVEVHVTPDVVFTRELGRAIVDLDGVRPVTVVRLSSGRITDSDLEFLIEMEEVHKLIIECRRITDEALKTIGMLREIDELRLLNGDISDEGLAQLSNLDSLETCWLSSRKLHGEGLAVFAGHKNLKSLFLSGSAITDEGAESLAKVTSLETLVLNGTQITDEGMQHLKKLPRLKLLNVESTEVTPQGVVDVQTVLPKAKILF